MMIVLWFLMNEVMVCLWIISGLFDIFEYMVRFVVLSLRNI